MKKLETVMLILILGVLLSGLWLVLSGKIWVVVSWLETLLYPTIVTPA